jgi:hypothetical protein
MAHTYLDTGLQLLYEVFNVLLNVLVLELSLFQQLQLLQNLKNNHTILKRVGKNPDFF